MWSGLFGPPLSPLGVGGGAVLHTVSQVVGRELSGTPTTDMPFVAVVAILLLRPGRMPRSSEAPASARP